MCSRCVIDGLKIHWNFETTLALPPHLISYNRLQSWETIFTCKSFLLANQQSQSKFTSQAKPLYCKITNKRRLGRHEQSRETVDGTVTSAEMPKSCDDLKRIYATSIDSGGCVRTQEGDLDVSFVDQASIIQHTIGEVHASIPSPGDHKTSMHDQPSGQLKSLYVYVPK